MENQLAELRNSIDFYAEYANYPELNGWRCVLCADIIVYLDAGFTPFLPNREGILDFYNQAMALVRNDMKWALINGDGRFRKINKQVFDLMPFWCSPEGDRGRGDIIGVDMHGGPDKNGVTDRSFSCYRSIGTHLRLCLPVEYLLENPQRFVELARSMLQHLKFVSGSAGFSLKMHLDGVGADNQEGSHIDMLSRRFPGLDIGIPWDWAKYAAYGLKAINWLTFVSDALAQRMQGREGVKSALPPDIPAYDLDHGLIIQAGPAPVLGDSSKQEYPDDYRRVGLALKPLAFPIPIKNNNHRHLLEYPADLGGAQNTERWCKRFFES